MTTWMIALAGGVLIGLSATLLLWLNGRVAGVSGILNGVLFPKAGDVSWRATFLLGLILAAGLYMALVPGAPLPRTDYSRVGLIVAGLLVGFGTYRQTSDHCRQMNWTAPPHQLGGAAT